MYYIVNFETLGCSCVHEDFSYCLNFSFCSRNLTLSNNKLYLKNFEP